MNRGEPDRTVSVVIPTHHRPQGLRRAVSSALAQELPPGHQLEVVVVVSDGLAAADVAAAGELATDPRVLVVVSGRPGPAAARNAGMASAHGSWIALMDDDCIAETGWLLAGLEALAGADLAQGRTIPDGDVPRFHHSLWVDPPSYLWESCNLFVRREAVDRMGGFDEGFNPTARKGDHFGEDAEWGWRLAGAGARTEAAPRALVRHAVRPRTFSDYLRYQARIRFFPRLFAAAPQARKRFYRRYFVSRRHVTIAASAAGAGLSLIAWITGARRIAAVLGGAATVTYLLPLRHPLRRFDLGGALDDLRWRLPSEAVEFAAAVYGSIRWRRLFL